MEGQPRRGGRAACGGRAMKLLEGHEREVRGLAYSPDGRLLASCGSHDGSVRLWAVPSGECLGVLRGHESIALAVAFSPDGRLLASGGHEETLVLWDVAARRREWSAGTHEVCASLAFTQDGAVLAAGTDADAG